MRAVAGLVLLIAVALAGVSYVAGPDQLKSALQTAGLGHYLPLSTEPAATVAAAPAPEAQPQPAPQTRYTPFRTIAVSEPTDETSTVATTPSSATTSNLVGRTEIAPPTKADATGKSDSSLDSSGDRKGHYKLACGAGQRLDHSHHRCVMLRHAAHAKNKNG